MKKLSRREALKLIGLSTVGGVLAACGAATPEAPEGSEPDAPVEAPEDTTEVMDIEISLWDIQNSFPEGEEPDRIHQMVADMFNINFIPVQVTWGDASEKYNTWAASGQLPEVIGAIAMPGDGRYYQWIDNGVVRSLPDVSGYSNISNLVALPEAEAFKVEGENYFLPRATYANPAWWAMDRGLIVRRDWLDQLGISEPETEQDYIDMTVAFVNEDPDGNGEQDTVGYTDVGFYYSQNWSGFGWIHTGRWMKSPDGKYRLPVSTEKALYLSKFLKRMYQAGGLDPDFATIESADVAIQKFASGKAGMLGRQVSPKHLNTVMNSWVQLQPDLDFVENVAFLHGPLVEDNYIRFAEKAYWSETYLEASVDDAKAERILELYEWLYSDEGLYTMNFGIEGQDWVLDDEGNVELLTPVDDETGLHVDTAELYPFTYAMSYLAAWSGDLLQYVDPAIPQAIRDMCTEERDLRVNNWEAPGIDWRVQAINVPEKQEMAVTFYDDWVRFISDESGASDEELYEAMQQDWEANGYDAAVEAITARAQELGLD